MKITVCILIFPYQISKCIVKEFIAVRAQFGTHPFPEENLIV